MASELEARVRELDDENKSGVNSARELANRLNLNYRTVSIWIIAKRRGFDSLKSYFDFLAQKNGFKNRSKYNSYILEMKKVFEDNEENQDIKYVDPAILDRTRIHRDCYLISIMKEDNEEIKNLFEKIIGKLPDKHQRVIRSRFYEEKTLEEIGKELKISRQRINQIEREAIKKLYCLAKQCSLYEIYTD
ncbi:MAG: sigma-70 family RNA polymerase sigma factor [Nanoarchaeota archaeon]